MTDRAAQLSQPTRTPLVFASILGADFARMGDACRSALSAGADGLHVDVMDGHFVPNLTMGPDMVRDLRRHLDDSTYIDVHLMVATPEHFIEPFAAAGADCITFHIETCLGRTERHAAGLIERIRGAGCQAGVAISPPTPVESLDPVEGLLDLALVMSVHPGFAGQSFIPDVLGKTRRLRDRLRPEARVEMDGGINTQTAGEVRDAGCDVIVAASALFGAADPAAAIAALRGG